MFKMAAQIVTYHVRCDRSFDMSVAHYVKIKKSGLCVSFSIFFCASKSTPLLISTDYINAVTALRGKIKVSGKCNLNKIVHVNKCR